MKKGLLFFMLFFIVGFFVSKFFVKREKQEPEYKTETIKLQPAKIKEGKKRRHIVLPSTETFDVELDGQTDNSPSDKEVRDTLEWQGMLVSKVQPPCEGKTSCGLALACLDGTCGPCEKDEQCGVEERCVLQHCVLSEKTSCNKRDDCEEEDALCVLSGYSSGTRGNAAMTAFCQSSSDLDEPLPDPEERRIFDEIRGPFEAADFEYSDLLEGLKYE